MKMTAKKKVKYYKNRKKVHKVIKKHVRKKGHIAYGNMALNAHLPSHLDVHTDDWDVFSNTPKKSARNVERKLDKSFRGDYFYVKRARYPKTHKVVSRVTKSEVADYTKPEEEVPYKKIDGVKYARLGWIKKQKKETLRDPGAYYRHKKDREALQRIALYELERKAKARKGKSRRMEIKTPAVIRKVTL